MKIQNVGHYDQDVIVHIEQQIEHSVNNYGQLVFGDVFERLWHSSVKPVSIEVDVGKKAYSSKIEEYIIFPGVGYRKSLILDGQVNRPHSVEYFNVLDGSLELNDVVREYFI